MKSSKLICFFGFLVALFAIASVAAELPVNINSVEVNDVELGSGITLAGTAGESVPVVVEFTSDADLEDLKVKVWVEGYKSDITASTARFDVKNGSTYIKRLSLTLPSVQDMDDVDEALTLYVRVSDKTDGTETEYSIELQRESYSFGVLSVETPSRVNAGDILALDVVLKNTGSRELEDTFVVASIPELGVQKKVYFGDLQPKDCIDDCDEEDARERMVYIMIPSDAKSGDYTVDVKATNYDATYTVRKTVTISGASTNQSGTGNGTNVIDTDNDDNEEGIPTSIIVLTAVLVIIFVVLLIVLIVLLTKRPTEKTEDFGETSYY